MDEKMMHLSLGALGYTLQLAYLPPKFYNCCSPNGNPKSSNAS